MPSGGPGRWDDQAGGAAWQKVVFVDGVQWTTGVQPNTVVIPSPGVVLRTGGRHITQFLRLGGNVPLGVPAGGMRGTVELVADRQEDYWLLEKKRDIGLPVAMYMDDFIHEAAYVADLPTSGSPLLRVMELSRERPWDLSGITHATRPPRAWRDGTELTLTTVSPPTSAQFLVAAAGGYGPVSVLSSAGGTLLEVQYHPEYHVKILQVDRDYVKHNDLRLTVEIEEVFENPNFVPGQVAV